MAEHNVTLMALGDIWLARLVADHIRREGPQYPFVHVAPYLRSADIVFGNLESPHSTRGTPEKDKDVVARASPEALEGLVYAGIDVVSLANNHVMDYGPLALQDTLRLLDEKGIQHLGAGMTSEEAARPLMLTKNGIAISFHAYLCWGEPSRKSLGPAGLNRPKISEALHRARGRADVTIVALHGGSIFQDYPTLEMIKLAHWVIDRGANVVIGHHPHVIQGIERYKDGLIAYSLGNFLFDSYQVELSDERTRQGLILKLDIHKDESIQLRHEPLPTRITDCFQVELVPEGMEREDALQRLRRLSSPQVLSESRGFHPVDQTEMVGKIKSLFRRRPGYIARFVVQNFFRVTVKILPIIFQLGWRKLKSSLQRRS